MPFATDRVDPSSLVSSRERRYFAVSAIVSAAFMALIGLLLFSSAEIRPLAFTYLVLGIVFFTLVHGLLIGHLRGNAVRVSAHQFPMLHGMLMSHAGRLGLATVPDAFVLQSGGVLNAFATRFLGRDFVVIYTDILEIAMADGAEAVSFIVAHELGHVVRKHMTWRLLLAPASFVPFLGAAYSRGCEYTCDRIGMACAPDGGIRGLLVLASGKSLYREVDARVFARQSVTESGFWTRFAELLSSHPTLSKRVDALVSAGAAIPAPVQAGAGAERLSVALADRAVVPASLG